MNNALYCDGGVIFRNPSKFGGTYAYRIVSDGRVVEECCRYIRPAAARVPEITNNLTELCAVVAGLLALPDDWQGTVYSDSAVTLGRVFGGYRWRNVPPWLHQRYRDARARLVHWGEIEHVLLSGHPTKKQLEAGIGRGGRPVSAHQVWCDNACQKLARMESSRHELCPNPARFCLEPRQGAPGSIRRALLHLSGHAVLDANHAAYPAAHHPSAGLSDRFPKLTRRCCTSTEVQRTWEKTVSQWAGIILK